MGKFFLENEYSSQIDLQDEATYCVASDVKNLGFENESNYVRIGDHFIRNYLDPKQKTLEMSLNFFRPGAYDKLQTVGNFLVTAEKLYLVYQPGLSSGIVYRREVEVDSFLKTSIKDGYLCYALKLNPTSLFYYKKSTKFEITEFDGEKRYDFTWDATYNDYANRSLTIPGGNHVDVAFSVDIYGYTERPKISVISGNKIVHELTIPVIVQAGEYISYSSVDGDLRCTFTDKDGVVRNIINEFDLTDNVFFKVPKAGASVQFTSDTDVMNTIIFTAYFFFKVV